MGKGINRKKGFHNLSTAAQFHTAPKLFGDVVEHPFPDKEMDEVRQAAKAHKKRRAQTAYTAYEVRKKIKGLEPVDTNEKFLSPETVHMKNLVQKVLSVKLNDNAKNDPDEKRKLKLAKEKIKECTQKVIESIHKYINAVLALDEVGSFKKDRDEIERADHRRRTSHNALIDDINILNRSLIWWFGEFDPDNLSEAQMEMYEKQEEKYITYDIERINIPPNGILPASYSQTRESITRWAKAIFKDLSLI